MNRINSTLRNIAVFITLVVLALAVFWLVSRQIEIEPQTVAQTTGQPTASTIVPQSTTEPTSSPVIEPTYTPFTPEVVTGKVTIITPPPPTPTVGPGSLVTYQLSELAFIPIVQNDKSLSFLGFSSDGTQLLTYHLPKIPTQPAALINFAISGDLTGQAIESHTLALDM